MALYIRLKHVNTPPVGTIENIEMEKYIAGVVAAELGGSQNLEALKAQAVASRSYAVAKMNKNKAFDVDDTTTYQAYKPNNVTSLISTAVSATSGQVLVYKNSVANTVYSSSNGGRIRSSQEVWGGSVEYLVSKNDPYTSRSGYKKYGHGVGMSQRGADQAASEGLSYTRILSFYYPGTTLKSNYNGTTSETVGNSPTTNTSPIVNKGNLIVQEARRHLGKPYKWGAEGPNSFDCSGFVYYVYKTAINYDWSRMTAASQYKYGRAVNGDFKAGDLLFFQNTTGRAGITHVGIAIGDGSKFIQASGSDGDPINESSLENSYWKSHYYGAKRLLNDNETSGYNPVEGIGVSTNPTTILSEVSGAIFLKREDFYKDIMLSNLEEIENYYENNKSEPQYGILRDMTNGGEFQFIVPEFSEDISANWDSVPVLGRSVDVKGYSSTQSRSIDISLELVAGAGLYTSKGDKVAAMHKDIAFVQSLEYPDYSKSYVFPPPMVHLYLSPIKSIKGVVTNVSVKYKKPYDFQNRPMMANLNFTVVQVSDNPPDFFDVRNMTTDAY